MQLAVFADYHELSQAAADRVASVLRDAEQPVLGLATGSTPRGLYRELVARVRAGQISFRHAHIFHLDEFYPLPPDHPASFQQYLKNHLLQHVDSAEDRCHFFDGCAADPAAEAARYEAEVRRRGGIDLQILGMGHNGHVAFNEPGSPAESRTRLVRLHPSSREHNRPAFAAVGEAVVPRDALTMGMATIMEAGSLLLMVSGAEKAAMVRRALSGPQSREVPASWLRDHPDITALLDRQAAAQLNLDEAASVDASGREHAT